MSLYSDASLAMIPSAVKDGKLYSIRPTDGSGDFTFSRGSNLAATRVDVNGLIEKGRENILTYSNTFDSGNWTSANISLTSGQSGYDGSNDAWLAQGNGLGTSRLQQNGLNWTNSVYSLSFYAKAGTESVINIYDGTWSGAIGATYNLSTGTATQYAISIPVVEVKMVSAGNGWWRCSFTAIPNAFTNTAGFVRIGIGSTTAANSGNLYIQDAQLEAGLVATDYIETTTTTAQAGILEDMPRLDYSGGASCPSLLLEPQRTNSIFYSEYFGTTWWLKYQCTILDNQGISPEGLNNAARITSTATGSCVLYKTGVVCGSLSMFAKPDNIGGGKIYISVDGVGSARWNADGTLYSVSGGTAVNGEDYGNGWFRFTFNVTSGSVANYGIQASAIGENMLIYGVQNEPSSSYPSSYIPTYGTSQTRSEDDCVSSNIDGLIGDNQGTLFVQGFGQYRTGADNHLISLSSLAGGSGTDRILIYTHNATGNLQVYINSGGLPQYGAPINLGVQGTDANDKIAVAFADNDLSVYVNGSKVGSSTSGTAPTMFYLAFNEWEGNHQNTSQYKQAAIFPTRLTDSELAALTTL